MAAEKWLEGLHETLSNLCLAQVFVHLIGVLLESHIHWKNLARAMLLVKKPERQGDLG